MVRRIFIFVLTLTIITTATMSFSYADVPISDERTSVTNKLPSITIYSDTDKNYGATLKNTEVKVNDKETDVVSVDVFKDTGEGVTYFILVDVSKSISDDDFLLIKNSIKAFSSKLSPKDKIYLVSFGDMVYPAGEAFDPASDEFVQAVESLDLKDDNTKLYEALGEIESIISEDKKSSYPERNISMVFTDGLDDTAGSLTKDEAVKKMVDAGVPLYAFAVGDNKAGKDSLGVFARSCNGSLESLSNDNMATVLQAMFDVVENTLVIKTNVRNSGDIMDRFTLRVYVEGDELFVKENIRAYKDDNTKDALPVTINKIVLQYWWVILIISIAIIAVIVLLIIKRNRGVVNVDGKIVYGSKVQKQYHIQVKKYNTKELNIWASVDGSDEITQVLTLVESLIVGRASICDLYFDDINMSRQHFSIEATNGDLYIADLNSTGGTYLNGVKISSKQKINKGDIITAGKTRIRINW